MFFTKAMSCLLDTYITLHCQSLLMKRKCDWSKIFPVPWAMIFVISFLKQPPCSRNTMLSKQTGIPQHSLLGSTRFLFWLEPRGVSSYRLLLALELFLACGVSWPSGLEYWIHALVFDQQSVGSNPGGDTCYIQLGRLCFLLYRPGFGLVIPKPTSIWTVKGVTLFQP